LLLLSVLGFEVTKCVDAISRAMRSCDAGSSNADAAGCRPMMCLIQAAWRASTECKVATAARIGRE
jgi:hypothetical protein